jgi:CHAT domain-containing protein
MDQDSAWAMEAKQHIQKLRQPDDSQQWKALLPKLEAASLQGDHDLVRQLVEVSPQSAREYALETALGGWGEAFETGNREATARWLRIASRVGEALQSLTGDASVHSAVAALEGATGDPSRLRSFALGHREFREGMSAYRPLRTGEAGVHFAVARDALGRAGSPMELWALCGLARIWGYEGRYDKALRTYRPILRQAERQRFLSLTGWTQWGWAWIDARQGRPMSALSRTRAMEEAYRNAGEAENLGAARFMIGQALFLLGQRESGWQYNHRALKALARLPTSFRRHVLLTSVSTDALEDGLPEASLFMQEEALRVAQEVQDPIRLTEIHAARAKLLSFLARSDEAMSELEAAKITVQGIPQDATERKLHADLLWTEGEVRLQQDPRSSLESLSRAIREYQVLNASAAVAYASLTRAQAYLVLGMDREAETDLKKGLQILEDPASQVQDEDLRLSYADSIEDAYDELIRFQWEKHHDFQGSLRTLERSRSNFTASRNQNVQLDRLPDDGVVVEYAVLKDSLLIWVLDRQDCQFFKNKIQASALDAWVEQFTEGVKKGSDEKQIKSLGAELHNLLIPKMVSDLSEERVVYFIPDKSLNKLPFAALWNNRSNRYFIEEHPVAISPSLAQLQRARGTSRAAVAKPVKSALLVGNPAFDHKLFNSLAGLPYAETEVADAGSNFETSETLTPEQATKWNILDRLGQFDVFVFAGHAIINQSHPSRSYLVIAPAQEPPDPGLLSGGDIQERKYHHLQLVVLSACSSIGPRASRASGLIGIARPFLLAGVPSVVGTLWKVQDKDGIALLPKFYSSLAEGMSPLLALREMQITAIYQKNHNSETLRAWSSFEIVVSQIN